MSSTPEEGEDGAPQDTVDLPDEVPEAGGFTNNSKVDVKQESDLGDIIDDTEDAPVADGPEQKTAGKDDDAESLVNEKGTVSQRRNIGDSDEETISIPDDSPSFQVWRRLLRPTQF
jgi:hypothetical protein